MPSANPFSPVVEIGGGASVGPVSGTGSAGIQIGGATLGDHHASAAFVLGSLIVLFLLYKNRFRFSTRVG